MQRFIEGCDFGEPYVNKIGPEQLNGHHIGYCSSGIMGDDATHGLEKYSPGDKAAADLMPSTREDRGDRRRSRRLRVRLRGRDARLRARDRRGEPDRKRAKGLATDLRYGAAPFRTVELDPLADLVRAFGFTQVMSTGTYLDSMRFRYHLARHFDADPNSVDAQVMGGQGTSEVFLCSRRPASSGAPASSESSHPR